MASNVDKSRATLFSNCTPPPSLPDPNSFPAEEIRQRIEEIVQNNLPPPEDPLPQELSSNQLFSIIRQWLHSVRDQISKEYPNAMSRLEETPCDISGNSQDRYTNISPFYWNRVPLPEDEETCWKSRWYINASSIIVGKRQYVATQGPLECSLGAFWTLLRGEGDSALVINLAMAEDNKCCPYWKPAVPAIDPFTGDIYTPPEKGPEKVIAQDTETSQRIVQRTFQIAKIHEYEKKTTVTVLHYENWSDMEAPNKTLLLTLIQKINQLQPDQRIFIHCSAGVGRTGVVLSLLKLQALFLHNPQNVFQSPIIPTILKIIVFLRMHRPDMVKSSSQLLFLVQEGSWFLKKFSKEGETQAK